MADEETPQFEHDCRSCTFLGRHEDGKGRFDLYHCPQGALPTLIARFSSNGPDYISGLAFKDIIPVIGEAYRRAVEKKLLQPEAPKS